MSEANIVAGYRRLWEILKLVVEPSGATAFAAVVEHAARFKGKRVGLVLTGGNIDLDTLTFAAP